MSKNSDQLLMEHEKIGKILINIPKDRKITYREEEIEGNLIGKPRFEPKYYEWQPEILSKVRDHLQDIWNFFKEKSYWFDNVMKEILHNDTRRMSKKSVLFLLERDVWETDEAYGDYLIEKNGDKTEISHYRFGHKFKSFSIKSTDAIDRKNWICNNTIEQIENQFIFLWKNLEIEIETCEAESHHKPLPFQMDDKYLKNQILVCKELLPRSKEASLLMLGRIQELFILKSLHLTNFPRGYDIIILAETNGIIDSNNKKLFRKIRRNYNSLKHKTQYNINNCDVGDLISKFEFHLK